MRKFTYFLLTAMLLGMSGMWSGVQADETLTLYESSTSTSQYVPAYGSYLDENQHNQFVFPASDLEDLQGKNIKGLTFYLKTLGSWSSPGSAQPTVVVSLAEVEGTTLSGLNTTADFQEVYSGSYEFNTTSKTWVITFPSDKYFTYSDKNLLVDIVSTAGGKYIQTYWYVKSATNAAYTYNASRSYLPRTTFTYGDAPASSCAKPKSIVKSSVSATSVSFSWTAGGEETSWQYICLPAATAVDWSNPDVQTATSATATVAELSPETDYKFYVRADCGSEYSDAASMAFTTDCEAKAVPYAMGFEESEDCTVGSLPSCWKAIGTPAVYGSYYHNGTKDLRINGNTEQYAILPRFNQPVKGLAISFWYKHYYYTYYPSNLVLGTMTDPTDKTTFTEIKALDQTNDYVQIEDQVLSSAPTSDYYIAFKYTSSSSSGAVYIDDISVSVASSCVKPTDLSASAASPTSINLSWTANGEETAWQVQYRVGSGSWSSPVAATTNPFTLTGLTAQTTYEIQVRANCGGEQSDWSSSIEEKTPCVAQVGIGFTEDFEGVTAGYTPSYDTYHNMPDCWLKITNESYPDYPFVKNSQGVDGSQSLDLYGGKSTTQQIAVLPQFTENIDELTISFKYKVSSTDGYSKYSKLQVGYYKNGTFTSLYELPQSTSLSDFSKPMTGAPHDARIAIALGGEGVGYNNEAWVDNISIIATPSCVKPDAPTVATLYYDGASLDWAEYNDKTAWLMQYSTDGETWTAANSGNEITSRPFELRGLTTGTAYQVQVRTICSNTESSDWSDELTFTPTCVKPSGLQVDSKTTTTATISWTVNSGETEWNVQYKMSSDATWTTIEGVTANPYTITGLTAGKTYQVKVAATCNGTYASAQSFDTDCDVVSLPFSEDFSGAITCWTLESCHASTGISSGAFQFYYSSNPPQYIISPELEVLSKPINVEFEYKAYSANYPETFHVGYSTTTKATSAFTWGSQITCTSTTYSSHTETLPAGTKYVAIKCTSDNQYYLYIDNFSVDEAPTCPKPTAVAVSSVTAHTASVSWTNGGSETTWKLQTSTDGTNWSQEIDVDAKPFSLTNLDANTTYYVRVKADCGGGDESVWSATSSAFETPCEAKALGWTENFDGQSSLPGCWSATATGTSGNQWTVETYEYHSSSHSAKYNGKTSSSNSADLVTPQVTISSDAVLEFWYKNAVTAEVYVNDGTTTTKLWDIVSASDWTKKTISLSDYSGKTVSFIFRGHGYSTSTTKYLYLDDIRVLRNVTLADNEDNTATLESLNGQTVYATIGRTIFCDGDYNTICLPFSLPTLEGTPLEGAKLYAFKYAVINSDELQVRIYETENGIQAGVPYLIKMTADENIVNPTFADVTVTASAGKTIGENEPVAFVGILKPQAFVAGEESTLFVSTANQLAWANTDANLKSFRAFFKRTDESGAPLRRGMRARIVVQNEVATGADNVQSAVQCMKVLENGQLIIIRDGVKYTVQGQKIQ